MCEDRGYIIFIEIFYSLVLFFCMFAASCVASKMVLFLLRLRIDCIAIFFLLYCAFSCFFAKPFLYSRFIRGANGMVQKVMLDHHFIVLLAPIFIFFFVFIVFGSRRIADFLFLNAVYFYIFYVYSGGLYLCKVV